MLFTSESVTEGHPDKLCDYISDSLLDAYLSHDMFSRVALETVASKNEIYVTGEVTSSARVDVEAIVREAIKEVGYDSESKGLDYNTCNIILNITNQSQDIAMGVNSALENNKNDELVEGAGDQGIMFGYATDETESFMPAAIFFAHNLAKRLTQVRKEGILKYLRPDGKTQVTVEYEEGKLKRIDTIVISCQHDESVLLEDLKKDIMDEVIKKVIPNNLLDNNTKYYINPTGRFVIGGPYGDSGLTGRKIIVDTYGGYARHGGGAFSGKDPTKVDRSAAYMARLIAKNIVANGYAKKCEIELAYAIGVAKPLSIYVNTFGTNTIPEKDIVEKIENGFDLTPTGIINYLDLRNPIYKQTTNYGHFGKESLSWEKVIKL